MLTLGFVAQTLTGSAADLPAELAGVAISDVVVDSRAATPNTLFVAMTGEKTDGHLFLQEAFRRGCVAAIAEPKVLALGLQATFVACDRTLPDTANGRVAGWESGGGNGGTLPHSPALPVVFVVAHSLAGLQKLAAAWRATLPVEVIGITGSVGKTTTKESIANVLAQRFTILRSLGNLNNEIGLPLTLLRLTPAHQRAVLEMGMYALGEIAILCQLAGPRIGVVTNIGPTHLERLGSIEHIAQAKAELVQALPPANAGGVAILNADDARVLAMAGQTRARVFTYGLSAACDLWADDIISAGLDGIHFRFHYGKEAFHLHLPLLGRHSIHTALRGAAVGLVEGLSWGEIIAGLQDVRGQLRLMVVPGLRETTLIDDTYNASPVSMLAALNLLHDIANGQRRCIAVLGDMLELGSYEEEGHRLVGGRAAQVVAQLIAVGPRGRWIAEEALATGMKPADVHLAADNTAAIRILQELIQPHDIILVKGSRGLAMEAIVDALSQPKKESTL